MHILFFATFMLKMLLSHVLSLTTMLWIDTVFLLNFALATIVVLLAIPVRLLKHLPSCRGPMRLGNSLQSSLSSFSCILTSLSHEHSLMALQTQSDNMPAVILKSLPVYQDFQYVKGKVSFISCQVVVD